MLFILTLRPFPTVNTTFAYGSTLLLGALHALEPGHGKSFIAAYLIGERLSARHIVALGFSLLISHFLLLVIIALLMKLIFSSAVMEQAHEILAWVGPVAILLFGFYLLLRHRHSHEEHALFHGHSHEDASGKNGSIGRSAIVGAIGGLLPCPTVIAPVLMSGAVNNFHNALFYIGIYVLGMGVVMTCMLFLFLALKETVVKKFERLSLKLNPHLLSALLIILVGLLYLGLRIFAHAPQA